MASFKKVTGSGRKIEGGKLVTYRQDFAAHYTGGAFRHNADQINMDPQIPGYLNPNVQGTMELLANAITGTEKEAYVTIGDGYAQGKYNVATEGSLKAAFDAALLDPQLQQGGLILIKAGVYHSALTIEIPAGISVMGENTGTYIFSQTATLFKTLGGETPNERWGGQGAASGNQSFQHTVISNLLLGDNLDGAADGGTNALPKVSSFIEIEEASNVQISYVTFIGRFGFSGGVQIPSLLTDKAINFPGGAGTTSTLTYLTVDHCMFDTMINPISFLRTDLTSSTLKVSNCRARTNSRSTSPDEDGFVSINIGTSGNVTNCTHIGTNATSYFLEIASGVAGGTASVDVIGNTTNGKLIDALTTGVQGVWKGIESNNTANNVKNNAWFTIVGDGVNSFGDINGPNALRTLLFTNAAKELPTTLYLGIGTHSLAMTTSTGIDQVFNFVGIDKDGEKPVVELSFGVGSATDALGRRTLVVGSRLENIVFKSTDSIFKTLSIGQEFVALKGVSLVVNECEFIDSGLVCGTEGGETPSLLIENSFFTSEDSAIDTDLFVVASIDIDKITLRDLACYPSGAGDRMHFLGGVFDFGLLTDGYALDSGFGTIYDGYNDGYFGQPLGLPNLSPGVQSITLDNVSYLLGDIPVANAINSSFTINAAPPVTVVSAWMVFNPGAAKDNKSTEEEFDTPPNTFDGFGYQWTIEPNVGAYYTKTSPTSIPYIYLENGGGKQELYGNSGDLRVRKDVGTTIILSNVTVPLQWNGGAGPTSFYITNNLDSFIPHSAKIRIVTLTITGTFTIAIGDLNIIFLGANAESLNFTNAVPIADGTTYNISALGAQTGLITVRGANSSGSYIIDCTEIDNGIDDEDLFIQLELFYTY